MRLREDDQADNVSNEAQNVVGLHGSGDTVSRYLQDWEVAKVALSCLVAMDMLCQDQFERFRRFEFDFHRHGFFLSDSNHTQCGRTCACAVACLYPHYSISNVVASVTSHDNMKMCVRDVCTKKRNPRLFSTEHHGKGPTCKSFVILGFSVFCVSVSVSVSDL